ncbi:MAG: ABC1 kinase family protein [Bradymonadia bacterium]
MSDEREIPRGRLGRLARLAKVGARAGVTQLMGRAKDGQGNARKAAEVMGHLRGLAAKVGQMASYIDGVVPPDQRDAYERWMQGLQAAAPTSDPTAIRQLVESQLQAPIDQLFAEWHDTPIASASIGQVHRAVTLDGVEVAVKVQHPGVAEAVESDLKNAGLLESALSVMGTRKFNSKEVLEVVRTRFREELDYTHEARRQQQFIDLHAGDPTIRIPALFPKLCAHRVMTSAFVRGDTFTEACTADEAARKAWVETLWRFVYKGNLVGGMFNADPHPGNYIFHDDGQVTFLDFGCIQEIPADRNRLARRLHRTAAAGDEAAFRATGVQLFKTHGGAYEDAALGYVRRCFEPHFNPPFRISRDFVTELVKEMRQMVSHFRKAKDDSLVPLPADMFFLNRLQFGFYSVVARLDAEVDYPAVERAFLEGIDD